MPTACRRAISSPADRFVFSLLRSQSDVVLVGAGTARAENYRPATGARRIRCARGARADAPSRR